MLKVLDIIGAVLLLVPKLLRALNPVKRKQSSPSNPVKGKVGKK